MPVCICLHLFDLFRLISDYFLFVCLFVVVVAVISDPRSSGRSIQAAEDVYSRIRNLDQLVRTVKSFYEVIGFF